MMGPDQQQPFSLSGAWTHSYEEDEGSVQVYRPSHSFTFPPSRRGRETLEFVSPGQVVTGVPGPDDRLQSSASSLTPLGMNRFRIGEARVIEVVEAGSDILKVRQA
jgi:hypothetical protein